MVALVFILLFCLFTDKNNGNLVFNNSISSKRFNSSGKPNSGESWASIQVHSGWYVTLASYIIVRAIRLLGLPSLGMFTYLISIEYNNTYILTCLACILVLFTIWGFISFFDVIGYLIFRSYLRGRKAFRDNPVNWSGIPGLGTVFAVIRGMGLNVAEQSISLTAKTVVKGTLVAVGGAGSALAGVGGLDAVATSMGWPVGDSRNPLTYTSLAGRRLGLGSYGPNYAPHFPEVANSTTATAPALTTSEVIASQPSLFKGPRLV